MAEDKFVQAVIQKLVSEGWDYLPAYSGASVDTVYQHWRDILNENIAHRLDGTQLSDSEFDQVVLELNKNKTTYDAQLMLAGAGGTIPLNRGSPLELEIFYGDEVAGGRSRYEIVNQITFNNLTNILIAIKIEFI